MDENEPEVGHDWDALLPETREKFGCSEHEVVLVQDAANGWICPVCVVELKGGRGPVDSSSKTRNFLTAVWNVFRF